MQELFHADISIEEQYITICLMPSQINKEP